MQIGNSRVTVKPAMIVLIISILVGVGGILAAGWYALGPRQSYGLINPKRWTFAARGSAVATLAMATPKAQDALTKTKSGYSEVNADTGFTINITQVGATPDSVAIRNVLNFEKQQIGSDPTFSFEGKSSSQFQVTFVMRDSTIKSGGGLIWSKSYTISGDWKKYQDAIPVSKLAKGKLQYVVISGHMGFKPGDCSLRNIYLR